MIKFRQFKPCGVYLKDIKTYTGYSDVKSACDKAGVRLWQLNNKEYAPLDIPSVIKVLKVIRSLQGERFLRQIDKVASAVNNVKRNNGQTT